MAPFFENEIFPDDIRAALLQHMQNPKATTGSDTELATALRRHDAIQVLTVDDIPEGDVFILDGRSFRKGQKLRTHYLCECLAGKGKYRVRGTAKITTSRSL